MKCDLCKNDGETYLFKTFERIRQVRHEGSSVSLPWDENLFEKVGIYRCMICQQLTARILESERIYPE